MYARGGGGLVLACAVGGALCGCAAPRFDETYYVGVYRKGSAVPLQFYRFQMKGWADFGSKTKFESGWYPAAALDYAVGESRTVRLYKSPKPVDEPNALGPFGTGGNAGLTAPVAGASAAAKLVHDNDAPRDCDSPVAFVVGPEGEARVLKQQRLVLFMATDPSPLTNAIQSFAQALDQQFQVMVMTRRQQQEAARTAQRQRVRATLTALEGEFARAGAEGAEGVARVALAYLNAGPDVDAAPAPAATQPAATRPGGR